jgi:hypothetical protein
MHSAQFKEYWLTYRIFMIFEIADFNWKHRNLIFRWDKIDVGKE